MLLAIKLIKKLLEHINIEDNPENMKIILFIFLGIILLVIVVGIIDIVSEAKLFIIAGKGGWECLIPFYYDYVKYKLIWGIGWIFPIAYIPYIKYVVKCITNVKMCKVYNRFTVKDLVLILLIPHIYILFIAFGKNTKYIGITNEKV